LKILISIEHLLTITSPLKDLFYFVLSFICIYGVRIIQTCIEKVSVSRGIENQHAGAMRASEEEGHCWIIFRGIINLPPPSLNFSAT